MTQIFVTALSAFLVTDDGSAVTDFIPPVLAASSQLMRSLPPWISPRIHSTALSPGLFRMFVDFAPSMKYLQKLDIGAVAAPNDPDRCRALGISVPEVHDFGLLAKTCPYLQVLTVSRMFVVANRDAAAARRFPFSEKVPRLKVLRFLRELDLSCSPITDCALSALLLVAAPGTTDKIARPSLPSLDSLSLNACRLLGKKAMTSVVALLLPTLRKLHVAVMTADAAKGFCEIIRRDDAMELAEPPMTTATISSLEQRRQQRQKRFLRLQDLDVSNMASNNKKLVGEIVSNIGNFSFLERLSLAGNDQTLEDPDLLSCFSKLQQEDVGGYCQLRYLDLSDCGQLSAAASAGSALSLIPHSLKHLSFDGQCFDDEAMRFVLQRCGDLESLELRCLMYITERAFLPPPPPPPDKTTDDDGNNIISNDNHWDQSLKTLTVTDCDGISNFTMIASLQHLQHLTLACNQVDADDLCDVLEALAANGVVRSLQLGLGRNFVAATGESSMIDECLSAFVGSMKYLEHINADIGPKTLRALGNAKLQHLQSIIMNSLSFMWYVEIRDADMSSPHVRDEDEFLFSTLEHLRLLPSLRVFQSGCAFPEEPGMIAKIKSAICGGVAGKDPNCFSLCLHGH